MPRSRRVYSIKETLIEKSSEAALSAVQIYNNPLIRFKSESYIVLMIVAWTYLLHAYYRMRGTEYRYFDKIGEKRRRFHRTRTGSIKYWELEQCLNHKECPLDPGTKNNLRFLIELRHQIEHQMAVGLDDYLSGRYQACALNYCYWLRTLFGEARGLEQFLAFSLQFSELSRQQVQVIRSGQGLSPKLKSFIADFDNSLSEEEYNNPRYSYRLLFTRKTANRPGQADAAVEWVPLGTEAAEYLQNRLLAVKEVERTKYLPSQIVRQIQAEGFPKFRLHEHTVLWQIEDAKNPAKGFGVLVAGAWYWYESWLAFVRAHCEASSEMYS
jgi:hypothetical protein